MEQTLLHLTASISDYYMSVQFGLAGRVTSAGEGGFVTASVSVGWRTKKIVNRY